MNESDLPPARLVSVGRTSIRFSWVMSEVSENSARLRAEYWTPDSYGGSRIEGYLTDEKEGYSVDKLEHEPFSFTTIGEFHTIEEAAEALESLVIMEEAMK